MDTADLHYLKNQFLTTTVDNYKQAVKMSRFHDSALLKAKTDDAADPDWAFLYDRFHPLYQDLNSKYIHWHGAGGTQEVKTLNLKQLFMPLTAKVNAWD